MISVASYNIRKSVGTDWRRRPMQILDVLNELSADIVALQEVDRRFGARISSLSPAAIRDITPYRPIHFGVKSHSLGWHGNTILVREGIEVLRKKRLILPALEPRGAVLADLQLGERRLRVVGMHLGLVSLWRKRQARAVLDQLADLEEALPTVMMGDLNTWNTDSGCLAHFAEDHHVITPGRSFHSQMPFVSFDRIITSLDIALVHAGVHSSPTARIASDHLPIWAQLSLHGGPIAQKRVEVATSHSY
ncbi:endonuclease/exonuclease/phosphatase family protein [Jiella sp. M17.18]|uniref:endonuclease/exonuclease/phosphatase family protein n=1 Tax=Jiella sp. M17.18 TaxID=3234247 RepID=UPI0034DE42AD